MFDPDSAVHRKVLQSVYDRFVATGDWPLARPLSVALSDIVDPRGLTAVCRDIGHEYILCEPLRLEGAQVRLLLRGLQQCGESGLRDVENFLGIARLAADKYRLAGGVKAELHLGECAQRLAISQLDCKRAWQVMALEGRFSTGGSPDLIYLSPCAGQLRDVRSADDYLSRCSTYAQQEIEENRAVAWSQPDSAPRSQAYFISHAAVDTVLARTLAACIEQADPHGFVFVASRPGDIGAGEEWLRVIREKLKVATTYVVLLTPKSIARPWIWFETGAAWMSENRLIPVVASGLRKEDVPAPLNVYQLIDLGIAEEVVLLLHEFGGVDAATEETVRKLVAAAQPSGGH